MKERPIIFSGPMIPPILADTKTQTRRIVKHPGLRDLSYIVDVGDGVWGDEEGDVQAPCPYGVPGDRLRVKESAWMWCERRPNGLTKTGRPRWQYVPLRSAPVHYAADWPWPPTVAVVSPDTGNTWGWRLKIARFLPAWASRITLEITDVRVERVQEIGEHDAIAEGVSGWVKDERCETARDGFRLFWKSLHGDGSWAANPWVWGIGFRKVEA